MNYDCSRPTSRVTRPPGGASSNIFGEANTVTKEAQKCNPSFQSSIFGTNGTPESPQTKPKPENMVNELNRSRESQNDSNIRLEGDDKSNLQGDDSQSATSPTIKSDLPQSGDGSNQEGHDINSKQLVKTLEATCSTLDEELSKPKCHTPVKTSTIKPKYQSSVFFDYEDNTKPVETSRSSIKVHFSEEDSLKISNIPMFDVDHVRPLTAPSPRRNLRNSKSTVFVNTNYPDNPKIQPGLRRRPKTAYKPATPTIKSSVFSEDAKEIKHSGRKYFSRKSTVFDEPPKPEVSNGPVSKTFQCTLEDSELPLKLFQQKRSLRDGNESKMVGSSCDVVNEHSPVIMSSDRSSVPLRDSPYKPYKSKATDTSDFHLHRSADDVITTSKGSVVHLKRQTRPVVTNSYKSPGFKSSCGIGSPMKDTGLWSCDHTPTLIKSGRARVNQNFLSQIFVPEEEKVEAPPLWSSDFIRAPMQSETKIVVSKSLQSTVFDSE